MRLILTILLIGLWKADAQMVINASAPYRPIIVSGCGDTTRLLDSYSGAAAAYSLRRLRAGYTGNAIRVRREGDNVEQDIGFDACGNLDTSAMLTFLGVNGGGRIATWYDQSGNARNMTQATAGNQPIIKILNGNIVVRNGKPAIFFASAGNQRLSVARILTNDNFSIFGAVGLNSVQANVIILAQHAGAADLGRTNFLATGSGADNDKGQVFFNNGTSYTAVTTNTYTIASPPVLSLFESESDDLGTTTIKINGAGTGTITGQTWTPLNTNTTMGAFGNGNNAMNGGISEIIIYSTKQSSAADIRSNINTYYSIY